LSNSRAPNAGSGCSAHDKNATASGACPAGSMACCKDGEKCANYVITVADMDDCCTAKIEKALTGVKNVKAVYADAGSHKVWVCTGNAKLDSKAAVKSVQKAGFKQVKYAGVDSEHCVHEMKASAAAAKKAS
jgi:copper chaperone CopZ